MIKHSAPTIGQEEIDAVSDVLRSGHLAQGVQVEAFEKECAEFVGRKHAVAVSSGTAALHLALGALGVTSESVVALPAYACSALMTAVRLQDAIASICDVGPDGNLDTDTLPKQFDVAAVAHLFGAPAKLPKAGLVIEDIAQSIGGDTGAATEVAIASFYATKLMTTGEGGMLLTDDPAIAEFARDRRDYDNRNDFIPRFSYKLTDIQAAMGRVQLKKLPGFVARRREIAQQYLSGLRDLPITLPSEERHIFFRFVVQTSQRDALQDHLNRDGIDAKPPVYRPAHRYFTKASVNGHVRLLDRYPGSDAAHDNGLSIPVYPSMLENEVALVIDSVRRFYEGHNS